MGIAKKVKTQRSYKSFDLINGEHPLKTQAPGSYIEYNARTRAGGKLVFFNFNLAKEMGLIPKTHPNEMNEELSQKIIDTFGIIIINEYDIIHKTPIDPATVKENSYMATRYLQLQHPGKTGKTSGDGRSIWNGFFEGKNALWDITSCGTGATKLSPATAHNNIYYQSGDPSISYGCGYAELLDGMSAAIMSEVFNNNGFNTERTLCVLEFEKGYAINVRAGKNLLRPSHFFNYLKQDDIEGLHQITEYYIQREKLNGTWKPGKAHDFDFLLEQMTDTFSYISALFESEYIFCWLDWDGDNVLMDGGIIDYGSVRQFGLYHHEYRYDDVERMSTNLTEQKYKARYTVQTFAQMVNYLKTGKKKNIKTFSNHKCLKTFDRKFQEYKVDLTLQKVGFDQEQREFLISKKKSLVEKFLKSYFYFESFVSTQGKIDVEDGINQNAVFSMRDLLRVYPSIVLDSDQVLEYQDFIDLFRSGYALQEDLLPTRTKKMHASNFQKTYRSLVKFCANKQKRDYEVFLKVIAQRAKRYNKYARITGDSIINITNAFLKKRKKVSLAQLYDLVTKFIEDQSISGKFNINELKGRNEQERFLRRIYEIVVDFREGI